MEFEREKGFQPNHVSKDNWSFDIKSHDPSTDILDFVGVKTHVNGAKVLNVTKNEILPDLTRTDLCIRAIVLLERVATETSVYFHRPWSEQPEFGEESAKFTISELLFRTNVNEHNL